MLLYKEPRSHSALHLHSAGKEHTTKERVLSHAVEIWSKSVRLSTKNQFQIPSDCWNKQQYHCGVCTRGCNLFHNLIYWSTSRYFFPSLLSPLKGLIFTWLHFQRCCSQVIALHARHLGCKYLQAVSLTEPSRWTHEVIPVSSFPFEFQNWQHI